METHYQIVMEAARLLSDAGLDYMYMLRSDQLRSIAKQTWPREHAYATSPLCGCGHPESLHDGACQVGGITEDDVGWTCTCEAFAPEDPS